MTLSELSELIGRNPSYIQQWIKYAAPAKLPEDVRGAIARALTIEESDLMSSVTRFAKALSSSPTDAPRGYRPLPQLLGKQDLPVYAAVEGGPGEMVVSMDPIDLVVRPWFLEHVPDAYAVVVTGESMEPVYEAGDIVLVNPKLPPLKGKDAIFTSEILGGDFRASIKRFLHATDKAWITKQFNPAEEVRFVRQDWAKAVRVVGKYVP